MKKEKVTFFEKENITDYNHAENIVEKENKKFKFILICTILSLISTVLSLLAFTPVLDWAIFAWLDIGNISEIIWFAGVIGAILTGPVTVLKTIFKVGKFAWYIIPFFPFDVFTFIIAIALALAVLAVTPAVFSAYNLYVSYLNKKEAESFIASVTGSEHNQEQTLNQQLTYKCPNCEGVLTYGESNCSICGTVLKWN